jgi:hypothetical protein
MLLAVSAEVCGGLKMSKVRSQNLVRIVTSAYGIGITGALVIGVTGRDNTVPTPLFHPLAHPWYSVVAFAAILLLVYGAFSYVMSVSDEPFDYKFETMPESRAADKMAKYEGMRVWSLARFISDLILAVLYVRVLLLAIYDSEHITPNVKGLLYSLTWAFGWVVLVRVLRYWPVTEYYRRHLPSIAALLGVGITAWFGATLGPPGKYSYGEFASLLLIGVVVYILFTDFLAIVARWWELKPPKQRTSSEAET